MSPSPSKISFFFGGGGEGRLPVFFFGRGGERGEGRGERGEGRGERGDTTRAEVSLCMAFSVY